MVSYVIIEYKVTYQILPYLTEHWTHAVSELILRRMQAELKIYFGRFQSRNKYHQIRSNTPERALCLLDLFFNKRKFVPKIKIVEKCKLLMGFHEYI